MKFITRLLAILAIITMSSIASAAGEFKEINNLMKASRWNEAETALNLYIQNRPSSAKAQYLLAQVYEHENRAPEALSALSSALDLDETARFASSGAVKAMQRRLGATMTDSPESRTSYSMGQSTGIAAPAQPEMSKSSDNSTPTLAILIVLLLVATACGGVWLVMKFNRKRNEDDHNELIRVRMLTRINSINDRSQDLVKKIKYEGRTDSNLSFGVNGLISSIIILLTKLKSREIDGAQLPDDIKKVDLFETQMAKFELRFANKEFTAPEPVEVTPAASPSSISEQSQPTFTQNPEPARPQQNSTITHEHHHYRESDNSSNVILTSLLASAAISSMSNSHAKNVEEPYHRKVDLDDDYRPSRSTSSSSSSYSPPLDFGGNNDDYSSSSSSDSSSSSSNDDY